MEWLVLELCSMCQALCDVRGKPAVFGAYNLMSGQTAHKWWDQSAKKHWRRNMAGAYIPFGRSGLSHSEWVEVKCLWMAVRSRTQIKKQTHSRGNPPWKSQCHQSQSLLSRLTLLSKRCEKEQFLLIALFIWAACLRLRGQAINVSTTYCWMTFSKLLIIHHLCQRENHSKRPIWDVLGVLSALQNAYHQ